MVGGGGGGGVSTNFSPFFYVELQGKGGGGGACYRASTVHVRT